jgi:hypothetical protein
MNEKLSHAKDEYLNIEIPEELDMIVKNTIHQSKTQRPKKRWPKGIIAAAAIVCLFVVSLNTLPAFAASVAKVPVLGKIVDVLTITHFSAESDEQAYDVNIDVPEIQGLDNTELQSSLNEQYLSEAKDLYDSFMEEIGGLQDGQLAHQALDAGYQVKVSTDDLLVIEHWKVEIEASGAESVKYDTIDLQNQILLTLPGLFKDDNYIETITANIKEQMTTQMAEEEGVMYFMDEDDPYAFHQINANQTFYINENHKLVIVFDEYAVAPGVMGVVEFEIPTEVIADDLAGSSYIQ